MTTLLLRLLPVLVLCPFVPCASLRVFILAGQSNMVGHASTLHLAHLLNNADTHETYQHLWTNNGWTERDDVLVHFGDKEGPLTVGYGQTVDEFGPELEFGIVVGDAFNETVLLIKCAWGGSALAVEFRPPSSGIGNYSLCQPKNGIWTCTRYRPLEYGNRYRDTIETVRAVLDSYNATSEDLAGLVWFQGFNDIIDYEKMDEYGDNLVNLIRNMRADLVAPDLPFVIGELGTQGLEPSPRVADKHFRFRAIQRNVTQLPEFLDNTLFVETSPHVVKGGLTFDGGYHYYGRADTFIHIGHAFGEGMLDLMDKANAKAEMELDYGIEAFVP